MIIRSKNQKNNMFWVTTGLLTFKKKLLLSLIEKVFLWPEINRPEVSNGLEVPRAGDRNYVMGSIHGWSRSHLT